jgi:Beta-lactamase enzyme family
MRILILFVFFPLFASAQSDLLQTLMQKQPEQFGHILAKGNPYEVQILYTQINRDAKNKPTFVTHQYGVDTSRYFYPASTVKFPAVLLALEKINKLNRQLPKNQRIGRQSTMLTDSAFAAQTSVRTDTSALNGLPSVEHYAKKILLVSDNDAYNRLYEFVGQEAFNAALRAKGYSQTRILHRLSYAANTEQNRHTNPIRFVEGSRLLYSQAPKYNQQSLLPKTKIVKGKGYLQGDSLVKEPFDFTAKNYFPLHEQQAILRAVLFPESVAATQRFDLSTSDYRFLYQYMSQLPSETRYPRYNPSEIWDSYCKFTIFGNRKDPMPKHIRVFNKVGDAYGFLLDNAYVVDFEKGVEFMLTAVIYCNQDQIFNDDKYEYDSVGFPFFANLGQLIYQHELTRMRPHKPDLTKFRLKYEK